jgi:hypothetical protein
MESAGSYPMWILFFVCEGEISYVNTQTELIGNLGVFVSSFFIFISFQNIQKLDDSKSEKLEALFYKLLSFSSLGSSNFWISWKLIQKSDKKLK